MRCRDENSTADHVRITKRRKITKSTKKSTKKARIDSLDVFLVNFVIFEIFVMKTFVMTSWTPRGLDLTQRPADAPLFLTNSLARTSSGRLPSALCAISSSLA